MIPWYPYDNDDVVHNKCVRKKFSKHWYAVNCQHNPEVQSDPLQTTFFIFDNVKILLTYQNWIGQMCNSATIGIKFKWPNKN